MADCSMCGDYPEGSVCTYAACPGRKFKIAAWPLHERPDPWTWGEGVRLTESARAELGSSFLHGEPCDLS